MVHKNLCTIFIQNYYKIKSIYLNNNKLMISTINHDSNGVSSGQNVILFLKLILFYLINKKFYRRRKRLIFLCYNIQIN